MESAPGKYEFFEHTADAKFKAYGKTVQECFANAAVACFTIITDTDKVKPKMTFPIEVKAKALDSLLFDFLDQLLFLLDTEGFLLHEMRQLTITKQESIHILKGVAAGDHHKGYDVGCNVKAVTYNEMQVRQTSDGWECQVVVDL